MIKIATILFADVVGSTAQAEELAPEETRALMAGFFEAMIEEIKAEGGTVERLIGDAIMVDFGVPIAREDDALRAVRTARRMLERLEKFNADKDAKSRIHVRIGINTGEVSTGGSLGEQLMVMGDAVNVAARLQQTADPGTIVIGSRTASAVGGSFELKQVQPLDLKGKSEPVDAFVVLDERSEIETPLLAPLVGRERELEILQSTFERLTHARSPILVTLVGDAGVGKTRLIGEFVTALDPRVKIVTGRCLPYGEGVTLSPFQEILRKEARVFRTDPSGSVVDKLRDLAALIPPGLAPEPDRVVAALAATIGLEAELRTLSDRDPREAYREILNAWRALFEAHAKREPLVVVIEDLYWADDTTLRLVKDLSTHASGPILFLGPVRPEFVSLHASWIADLKNYATLTLEPLELEDSARLVSLLLDLDAPLEAIRTGVLEKAEGNPFFLEEIVHRLIDQGILVRSEQSWTVVGDITDADIPDNLNSLVLSRIDLLEAWDKRAIQAAAVVGRNFWPAAVSRLLPLTDLEDILARLQRRHLISERLTSSVPGETEYTFRHVLIRDVAYQSLPRRARGEAHASVAEWMQSTLGARAEELAEQLAHHYDHAFELGHGNLKQRARYYYLKAARNALRRFAITQAEAYGRRAVALSSRGVERIEAWEAVGDLFSLTFKSDGAWESYRHAIEELESLARTDPAALARLAGKATIVPTRWRDTMTSIPPVDVIDSLIDKGLAAAVRNDDPHRSRLLSSRAFLQALSHGNDAASRESATEAISIAERVDDPDLLSVAMDAAVNPPLILGRWGDIHGLTERRVRLVPRLTNVREICDAYGMASISAIRLGDYRQGLGYASEEVARSRGLDAGSYLQGLVWRVVAYFMLGEWNAALQDQREIERLHRDEGETLPGPMAMRAYTTSMLCFLLRGETEIAERYETLLDEFHAREKEARHELGGLPDAARAFALQGKFAKARALLSAERDPFLTIHLEAWCDVLAAEESWDDAEGLLPRIRDEVAHAEVIALGYFADRLEGRLAATRGDFMSAEKLLRRSADGFAGLGAVWEEALSKLLLGQTLAAAGKPTAAITPITAAVERFSDLGSVEELRRGTRALAELARYEV